MGEPIRLPLLKKARPFGRSAEAHEAGAEELMQVGDLARLSSKTVRALHLYEELELLRPVARSRGGYRLYSRDALVRIRWIGKLQDLGFSLSDIKTIVKDWEHQGSAPKAMARMREVYENKLAEMRAQLRRLEELEQEISASISYLSTCNDVCDDERHLDECSACAQHAPEREVPELIAGFRL